MNQLLKNFIQLNLRGLQYVGFGYELATRFISFPLLFLASAFTVLLIGIIDNFISDSYLVGIIGLLLFSSFILFVWFNQKIFFPRNQSIETFKENKLIVVLLTITSFGFTFFLFCFVSLYFFGT